MNLLIVGNRNQPIPPVKGGAVENLIKMFYEENEKIKEINISVISCKDELLDMNNYNYNKTKFYFVERGKKNKKLNQLLYTLINKLFKISWVRQSDFVKNSIKCITDKKIEFDAILIENYIEAVLPFSKSFPDKKIYFHLHNDKLNSQIINGKKIVKACDKIITVSDYIKNRVNTIKGANKKTITLINSINVEKFGTIESKNNSKFLKEEYNLKKSDFLIIFTGRITKTKGVLELVKAFSLIDNLNIKLMIIGNSWYGSGMPNDKYMCELRSTSDKIRDRIIFTGYVDYEKIPDYYLMADLVIIPSIWQEPCSLTLFEAMASGVPLITTKTGGSPEVVKDYATVIPVNENFIENLKKEIDNAYKNSDFINKRAEKAYKYIQTYNPTRYYKELCEIIKGEK